MDSLVHRLSQGRHPINARLGRQRDPASLLKACQENYVHICFPATQGGTELGIPIDPPQDWSTHSAFVAGQGSISFTGRLSLNYVPVRCHVSLDVESLEGVGFLEPLDQTGKPAPDASAH